ncbi:hypothetical protein ACL02S_19010 [Nocardia sp. 004]|uniref:hypothetical protein n=1 Tax=Nocardia sp. 004 TaxID=3385978 RepID=UPI00399F17FD
MKRLGPWFTLAAALALGVVLLMVNMSKDNEPAAAPPNTTTESGAPPPASPPPTSEPPPPGPALPAQADYVGTIPLTGGTVITLAIAVEGDAAIAYACDGANAEAWLRGSVLDTTLQLTGKGDARLDGRYNGTVVTGTLVLGGKRWDFTAAPVQSPAGLYVYREDNIRQSWIIAADGTVTGVQRAADGTTAPAPGLAPDATAFVGGKQITASKVEGGDDVG